MLMLEHSLTMTMEKITDESHQRHKRSSDQGPSGSSTSSQLESLSSTTRHLEMEPIPKKPRKSIEEDPVAQARKALEMFKEIEDEDADISITAEKIDKKTTTEKEEKSKTENPKTEKEKKRSRWLKRVPIISQQENLLL